MIRIVNRGYLSVKPKEAFLDWAKQFDADIALLQASDLEANIYLIEEDLLETENLIEKYYKKILENELLAVADQEDFPPNRTIELFFDWFDFEIGNTVFDTQKTDLLAE